MHHPMTYSMTHSKTHPMTLITQSLCFALLLACLGPAAAAQDYAVDATGLPILNSNPDAVGVLYMDFTGGVFNSTTFQPFNNGFSEQENDPNTYFGSERVDIYDAWRDVSTHFAMFDINVTTVDPDKTVTPTGHQIIYNSTGGGSANTNVFGLATDAPDQARSVNSSRNMRNRTTSITHEFGHVLGLNHHNEYDEQGNYTAQYIGMDDDHIASLMGIDYGAQAPQIARFSSWQQGRTLSNQTPQDDRSIITNKLIETYNAFTGNTYTGDGYRRDEHGNTRANATWLTLNNDGPASTDLINVSASATGIIERLTDTDMFRLQFNGGDLTATAEAVTTVASGSDYVVEYASSLGMLLSLYDSDGQLIAQDGGTPESRTGTGLADITFANDVDATVSLTDLQAGTYFLGVSSLGEYDDVGAYTLELTGVESTLTLIPEPSSLLALLATTSLLLRRRR